MPVEPMTAATAPTVSIAFVRSAVRALSPRARLAALHEAGIASELLARGASRVPAAAFAALWMAVARTLDDEFFGLDARRMKVGSFALLCHAAAGQDSVGRALRLALRGFGLIFDDIAATLTVAGATAKVAIDNRIGRRGGSSGLAAPASGAHADADDARRFADETLLVMIHGLLCWLAGRRVPLLRLDWGHPQPAHADEYRRMFAAELHFDCPATAIVFDARVLTGVLSASGGALKAFLREAPQSVFLKQVAQGGCGERVRQALRSALARGDELPGVDALARALGLSPATLRRRLDGEGTSWQQIKDGLRRDLALRHLADPALGLEAVAHRLGFDDAGSFHRVFRRWTGLSPGAWRRAAAAGLGPAPGKAPGSSEASRHLPAARRGLRSDRDP
jgi:AraC-like DNA-binding protein